MGEALKNLVRATLARFGLQLKIIRVSAIGVRDRAQERRARAFVEHGVVKAHYGSAKRFLADGWLNIDAAISDADIAEASRAGCHAVRLDLTQRHPFDDDALAFGFAGDFLEHLDQEQSLRFLIEAYRTLRPGGVLRLSFPGFEQVLAGAYRPATLAAARHAAIHAYVLWEHKHFYSRDTLAMVARHVGFRGVAFESYGFSQHGDLCGLEHRSEQVDANTYAELRK